MFNIKIKGKYTSDEQLIKGKKLPKDAIEFGKVESITSQLVTGILISLPIYIIMIALTIIRLKNIDYKLKFDLKTILIIISIYIASKILLYIHEIIHALFYPRKAEKTIWNASQLGAYFIYCDEHVSKIRHIIIYLAPTIILGVIPFIIWFIFYNAIPMPYNIGVIFTIWIMIIMGVGDISGVYYVIKEVPKNSKIFNHGLMHSYYIKNK